MIRNGIKSCLRVFFGEKKSTRHFVHSNSVLEFRTRDHLGFVFRKNIDYEFSDLLKKMVFNGDIVFDIGANIGQFTIQLSEWVGDRGKVIAFEPDPKAALNLQNNLVLNKINNCVLQKKALGTPNENVKIYLDALTGGRRNSTDANRVGNYNGEFVEVESVSYRNCIAEFGVPQLVKIDVEGHELVILDGMNKFHQNSIYVIEIVQENLPSIFTKFKKNGFIVFKLLESKSFTKGKSKSTKLQLIEELTNEGALELFNYLFIHPDNSRLKLIYD